MKGCPPAGNYGKRWRAPAAAYWVACLVLFTLLFSGSYRVMWDWWRGDDYNHCYFVPLISLYLLYEKRLEPRETASGSSWGGVPCLLAGLALYWLGELGGEFYSIYLGSWLVLMGCLWGFYGWRRLRAAAFPAFFLLAMFPFPNSVNFNLTLRLKLLSSQLGVAMMHLCGMTAFREGNLIDLGFTKLQVVDACSGIRFLFPLILLALLLAYHLKGALWKKLLLVASAVPVSVVTNSFRIASVGVLYQFFGPMVAEGFFHDFSGWFIFMCSLGLLLLERRLLLRVAPRLGAPQAPAAAAAAAARAPAPGGRRLAAPLAVTLLLLASSVALSRGVDFTEKVPVSRPLSRFPLAISGWQGVRAVMDQAEHDLLKFDDYTMVDYTDPSGKTVSLYVAYYGSQTKGGSIHSPATCLPGNGWIFKESGDCSFAIGRGEMRVYRNYMQKDAERNLTYYWFPKSGRTLTNLYQLKLYTFWDALTRRRTDGALVRLVTPIYDAEQVKDADTRLRGFTGGVVPELAKFLPL